jgi:hypothetical protein
MPEESAQRAAVREFVAAFPDVREAWNEHLRDNEGESLPHIFFDDVGRAAADIALRRDEIAARRLAEALEPMAGHPDADVQNIIEVSFVEYFVWGDDEELVQFEWLKPFFGPAMHQRIREFVEYSERMHESAEVRPPKPHKKKPWQKQERKGRGLRRRRG